MSHFARILALATLAVSLFGCGSFEVVGNGKPTTATREVQAFKSLSVSGGIHVLFSKGAPAASIKADENLINEVELLTNGDVLLIRTKHPVADTSGITLTLSNEVLEGLSLSGASGFVGPASATPAFTLEVSGASTATLTDLSATEVSLSASGASEINLSGGATTRLLASASGASKIDSHDFVAQTVAVEISGASSAYLSATQAVSGSVSGASTLTVSGAPPTLNVTSSGGSRLIKEG